MTYVGHPCAAVRSHTLSDFQGSFEKLPDLPFFVFLVILGDVIHQVLAFVVSQ